MPSKIAFAQCMSNLSNFSILDFFQLRVITSICPSGQILLCIGANEKLLDVIYLWRRHNKTTH